MSNSEGIEFEVKNGRFWLLENSAENDVQRYIYDNPKLAIERLKKLMETINYDKLLLSSVEIDKDKGWNITNTPWAIIAMGLVRGDLNEEIMEYFQQQQAQAQAQAQGEKKVEKKVEKK